MEANAIGYLITLVGSGVLLSMLFYKFGREDGYLEAYRFFEKELP